MSQNKETMYGLFGIVSDDVNTNTNQTYLTEGLLVTKHCTKSNDCCVCKTNAYKYRCPACHVRTCSLNCCQKHKQLFKCSGVRDKLAYVKVNEFNDTHLISDYTFLDDTERTLDGVARERRSLGRAARILPKWIQRLRKEARFRGVRLIIMPSGFRKRKQNTTCYNQTEHAIYWHIVCNFPHALDRETAKIKEEEDNDEELVRSHSEFTASSCRVPEGTILAEFVEQHIAPKDYVSNYDQFRKLEPYRNARIDGITVLFKLEYQTSNVPNYAQMDLTKTIKENLIRKTVIEFPTFVIVLNKFKHLFHIID